MYKIELHAFQLIQNCALVNHIQENTTKSNLHNARFDKQHTKKKSHWNAFAGPII